MSYKETAEGIIQLIDAHNDKEETTFIYNTDNAYIEGTAYWRVERTRATYLQPAEECKTMVQIVISYAEIDDIPLDAEQEVELENIIRKTYNEN